MRVPALRQRPTCQVDGCREVPLARLDVLSAVAGDGFEEERPRELPLRGRDVARAFDPPRDFLATREGGREGQVGVQSAARRPIAPRSAGGADRQHRGQDQDDRTLRRRGR